MVDSKLRIVKLSGILLLVLGVAFIIGGIATYPVGNMVLNNAQSLADTYLGQADLMISNGQAAISNSRNTLTSLADTIESATNALNSSVGEANSTLGTTKSTMNLMLDTTISTLNSGSQTTQTASLQLLSIGPTLRIVGDSFSSVSILGIQPFAAIGSSINSMEAPINIIGN